MAEKYAPINPYNSMGNNPISFTDPDGDDFGISMLIGAGIGVLTNGLSNSSQGQSFFKGTGQAAFFGAVGAGMSLGVGNALGAAGSFGKEAIRAGMHAVNQGGISAAQGGNFWQGALSGGLSSGIGSGIGAMGGKAFHQILGGGISGGIGSSMAGGGFWGGFGQGIAVGAFNHALHDFISQIEYDNGNPMCPECIVVRASELIAEGYSPENAILTAYWEKSGKPLLFTAALAIDVLNSPISPGPDVTLAFSATNGIWKTVNVNGKKIRVKLLKNDKTDFSKTNKSRGQPDSFPTVNPTPKSRWAKIFELLFGNFQSPK